MRARPTAWLLRLAVILCFLLVVEPFVLSAHAGSRGGGFRSSSSFSRSSSSHYSSGHSWSSRTHDTWTRSGGGFFGSGDKGSGYTKPVSPSSQPPQGSPPASGTGSTGYTKPSYSPDQSSGYSKPIPSSGAPAELKPSSPSSSSAGYSKPSTAPAGSQPFQGGTRFDKETIKGEQKKASQQALEKYKAERSSFSKPPYQEGPFSGPLADRARSQTGFDYGSIARTRDFYYRSQGYQPPPYVFDTSPSFGIFNTLFLFWMLDHITNKNVAKAAYNYSDDPAFQKWRQEVENLSKDNAELRSKLAEMDKQIKALEGSPKDPAYLPPGVPVEAALAPGVFGKREGEKPVLRFAGGRPGGWYDKYVTLIEKNCSALAIKPISTSGSVENLKLLASGQADIALVQSDVLAMRELENPGQNLVTEQTTLFLEYVQLLAHRDGGVKSLRDLDPAKHEIFIGPKDSGTAQTWQSLCKLDSSLARIKTRHADYFEALEKVEKNPNVLMLFVGGLRSDFLKKAEEAASKKDRLRLVPIDDRRFTELRDKHGNTVYHLSTIPARIYPNLQSGWIFAHDVKTLTVQAVLVLRNEWAGTFGSEAMDALSLAILETRPKIEKMVNG